MIKQAQVPRIGRGRVADPLPRPLREQRITPSDSRESPNRHCKKTATQSPETGKSDYFTSPNQPARPMAWEFFTDDCNSGDVVRLWRRQDRRSLDQHPCTDARWRATSTSDRHRSYVDLRRNLGQKSTDVTLGYWISRIGRQHRMRSHHQRAQFLPQDFLFGLHGDLKSFQLTPMS